MGLLDSYGHVKDQILIMKPLPNVNRAYSMVLSVEKKKKKEVQNGGNPDFNNTVMSVRGPKDTMQYRKKGVYKKR